MARNVKFYFDDSGSPCARGPQTEKLLMAFLETDIQGDDHICHDLMEDIRAIEDGAADDREFTGNAHSVDITRETVKIICHAQDQEDNTTETYTTSLRHFREIVEDWEAFILDGAEI